MSDIDEANKLGNLFNSWGKIIVSAIMIIASCVIAYIKIYSNETDIALEKKERIEQFDLMEKRSDNRYNRAMEVAKDLKEMGVKEQERVRELEKEVEYLKGEYESTH